MSFRLVPALARVGRRAPLPAAVLALIAVLAAPAGAADGAPVAVIAAVKGRVEVVAASGGAPQRAAFGRGLERGDRVTVAAGASATLFFSDGNVIELGSSSSVTVGGRADRGATLGPGAGLPGEVYANVSRFVTGGSRQSGLVALSSLRGTGDRAPLLLAPRKTEVLEPRPAFAWRAVEGAARYRLALSGETGELWSRETAEPALAFPDDAAALEPGADYLWEVQALSDRGVLAREDSYFRVVTESEATAVREHLARIESSAGGAGAPAAAFLTGSYLFGRGLLRDAATRFEALCRLSPDAPAPHEALGNVYRAIGLTDQAASAYEKALELARQP